ncbi:DEAD/DEAH box helicase [Hydrogenoanaerobacterium sp.]|uniref:DEAD/DEAH box helicase n=1 Tax=Hydrogenoanaerobacterium sp. TaxID=2953763 RepID=UPI00289F982D|nr:DEAD/DEAH box helicase [Hydrogenoanaerobacterium sp.]
MKDQYSVEATHSALKEKMLDYIKTVYLGKNDALRLACEKEIEKDGELYQEPYIEANQSYLIERNGIANMEIPKNREVIKSSLVALSDKKVGVFPNPYLHQIKVLNAFASDKDVFVATGTGSGKTECFMWPMVGKLLEEAQISPGTWEKRGVRALMLYPMNALVSDQLGRLRKMIGSSDFQQISNEVAPDARIPQFGMYTGRTPYAGEPDLNKDKELAKTIRTDLLNNNPHNTVEFQEKEDSICSLKNIGKYPAKKDLYRFVEHLTQGEHFTACDDVELITRQEIRQNCPDILITNYSMLQYMLIRPIENCIWKDTQNWLKTSPDNKLLFIIDEAHMYKGSAGGEVALLIRRFMHKLGISRDRIQFILTSASMPKDGMDAVNKFACDLTAQTNQQNSFEVFIGDPEQIDFSDSKDFDPNILQDISIDDLHNSFQLQSECIKKIANKVNWEYTENDFSNMENRSVWLCTKLRKCKPMLDIIKECRGKATKFDALCSTAFPYESIENSRKATSLLLSLAHLAKTPEGSVFFPTRLHLMFRGLKGLSACSNPNCGCTDENAKSLGLGKIYLGKHKSRCLCGGKIFELVNDRTCGAIFLKGYVDSNSPSFIWNHIGENFSQDFKEVYFYPISGDNGYKKGKEDSLIWVDSSTGKIYTDDFHAKQDGFIHLAYSKKERKGKPGIWTFSSCPKCGKRRLAATDFVTKGNEPFFNLVSEQFYIQPPTMFEQAEIEKTPNAGRKVLLFSDSRQKAAILAKDLTRAADEDAMKKALTIALIELQNWAKENHQEASMNLLYIAFLKISAENNLRFFYGDDEVELKEDIAEMQKLLKRYGGKIDFIRRAKKFDRIPKLFYEQLIKQMCSNFRSLTDAALAWVVPCDDDTIEETLELFEDAEINLSRDDFEKVFASWAIEIMTDTYSLGSEISDSIRGDISIYDDRFGLKPDAKLPKKIEDILKNQLLTDAQIQIIWGQLQKFLSKGEDSDNKYLSLHRIALKYDNNSQWHVCPRCSGVSPFTLWGTCARCGKASPVQMETKDFERIKFWREPVLEALNGDKKSLMTRINVEEHTAQLSHKDGKLKTWSTTEDFEMRFQNIYANNDKPVDVLSCTTTMEVGIDIGSLTAIGLRNVPPMRENYQQRAGRAGRRSSAISTIVTYTDNGPYDSYYYYHPEKIISGDPRKPWIDVKNQKLIHRHLNTVMVCSFFEHKNISVDQIGILTFFASYYNEMKSFLSNKIFSDVEILRLLPSLNMKDTYRPESLVYQLDELNRKSCEIPENYKDDEGNEKSFLDCVLEEGIFPTYSFPRNIVGFHIEKNNGKEIEQKPDRSIDIALSEYAPGRIVVVNKKSYKSGGIYNYHSKFAKGYYDKPAAKYIHSKDFYKTLYMCANPLCTWVDYELPSDGLCPFCNSGIHSKSVVKPWGFAPLNGMSIREAEAESENSYATSPAYALPLDETQLKTIGDYKNVKCVKLPNQPLTMVNRGISEKGFYLCKICGAAVPGDEYPDLKQVQKPYKHPYSDKKCFHPESECENIFLGHQMRTDMVVYEVTLDDNVLDVRADNIWLSSAAQTLAEAMALSAGKLLDIEFTDIKSGFRIRYGEDVVCADIFLFDNLSSGAGYSSAIAERSEELFEMTRETLMTCKNNCDSACQECLKHFWNQSLKIPLNRKLGIDLLDWICEGKLHQELSLTEQEVIFSQVVNLFKPDFTTVFDGKTIKLAGKESFNLYIYPVMWSRNDSRIPKDSIAISDKMIKESLPEAYRQISEIING